MSSPKVSEYSLSLQTASSFARLLAHPARLRILEILAEEKTCVCGRIVDGLPLAQSTVSQHLRELKEGGLIKGEIEGTSSCYCIDWEQLWESYTSFRSALETILEQKQTGVCCE